MPRNTTTRDDDDTELEELEATVTDEVLEQTPARALTLLRAVGSSLRIRRALVARGYDAAAHREGWSLIQATIGFLDEREVARIYLKAEQRTVDSMSTPPRV